MLDIEEIKRKLLVSFKDENIKKAVLQPEWLKKNKINKIDSTGFCYSASEVIFRLNGGKENWKKVSISETVWPDGGHCYLINKHTKERLDITKDQYESMGINIPYHLGVGGGFQKVSKAAIELACLSGLGKLI